MLVNKILFRCHKNMVVHEIMQRRTLGYSGAGRIFLQRLASGLALEAAAVPTRTRPRSESHSAQPRSAPDDFRNGAQLLRIRIAERFRSRAGDDSNCLCQQLVPQAGADASAGGWNPGQLNRRIAPPNHARPMLSSSRPAVRPDDVYCTLERSDTRAKLMLYGFQSCRAHAASRQPW